MLPDLQTHLPRKLTFSDPQKFVEMAKRGGMDAGLETRAALEHGISIGRGGVWLNLTEEAIQGAERKSRAKNHSDGYHRRHPCEWRGAMQKILSTILCALLVPVAYATDYEDGTLVSFRTVNTGQSCTHTTNTSGTVDDSGNVKASSSGTTNCSDDLERQYTVKVGNNTFVIAHVGFTHSVLWNSLPGAAFKMRFDGKHVYVKVADKESKFFLVSAAQQQSANP